MRCVLFFISVILIAQRSAAVDSEMEFFEKRIRPLLVEHCQECHGKTKQKGGLRLDHQMGWQVGGDSGPALVPRKVHESLLLKAVSYTDRDLKMPPQKKLNVEQLADLLPGLVDRRHDDVRGRFAGQLDDVLAQVGFDRRHASVAAISA